MNYSCLLGNKSDALRLDLLGNKSDALRLDENNMAALNNERVVQIDSIFLLT